MNPLHWKREHQVALVGTIALGAVLGFLFGLYEVYPYGHSLEYVKSNGALGWIDTYWLLVVARGLFGAVISGVAGYLFQLSRA